ncbi:hypothetical protein [Actinomadura violacea]|uniref:Uncharacterized protein n=1 Tax=Actinomadura violacea TaxID=2819934 RepID=A0ABS3RXY3_9ACTN|nr:hypothetical protein [Actinomadura violacea]MBO2461624.1 hypothetical protein [Actinomadura violacea]
MATNLSAAHLERLREQARRDGRFIDPDALRKVRTTGFHTEWATAILGRSYPGLRELQDWEIELLALALDAEPDRPVPATALERRATADRARQERERAAAEADAARREVWHELQDRLPVPVIVGHNWTLVHDHTYQSGGDHIVVAAELRVGRLYRPARNALCEPQGSAASRRVSPRNGTSRDPLRGLERDDDGQDRVPTCKTCLKTAHRIALDPEGSMAMTPRIQGNAMIVFLPAEAACAVAGHLRNRMALEARVMSGQADPARREECLTRIETWNQQAAMIGQRAWHHPADQVVQLRLADRCWRDILGVLQTTEFQYGADAVAVTIAALQEAVLRAEEAIEPDGTVALPDGP